jgi:SAM-dependent methyltransferase
MDKHQKFYSVAHEVSLDDEPFVKKHQQKKYLPYFKGKGLVVDLGCGGGRFLQLLAENNIPHLGVEINKELAQACKDKGLNVRHSEVLPFLKKCRPESVEGFFVSHLIEHLYPQDAIEAFQCMSRALKPGGVIVMITPNCRSLGVMTRAFWEDPTHVRPYPSDLLVLLGKDAGLTVLDKGETDMDTSSNWLKNVLRAAARGAYRAFRRILIGDFFRSYDFYMVFQKPNE